MYLLHIHKNTLIIACIVCDEMVNDKLIEVFFLIRGEKIAWFPPLKGDEDLRVTSLPLLEEGRRKDVDKNYKICA